MSILTRIADALGFGKAEVRPQNATYSDEVMAAFGVTTGAAGQAVTPITAMRVAAVFACVEKIAGAIGTLPLHVYRTDGETPVRQPRDDLWFKLNEAPTRLVTASAFWENVNSQRLLRGDSFAMLRYGLNGTLSEVIPLPWDCVTPQVQGGVVKYYVNLPQFGISTVLPPEEILHFKSIGFDMRTMRSPSTIQYGARAAVGNALAMDQYSGKFFENGAHPSTILKAPGKMTKEQIDRLQEAFANKYSGADNFHRLPLVLTEGLDAQEISLSAQDAQLLEARKFQVIDIARAFGVPPHMIGETSASTSWGSGIEAMSRGFVTYTLKRHLKYLEDELNHKLFPRNTGRFVKFDLSELIEGDSKAQAEYNRSALGGPGSGMGWMTVDEVRRTRGLKPLGGKAAELFDPNAIAEQQMAAAEASKPDPAAQEQAAARNHLRNLEIANASRSVTNITLPAQEPPVVNNVVNMPEPQQPPVVHNVVNVAAQEAPIVNTVVNVPEQPAPVVNTVVNVPEANVTVEAVMPEQPAPNVQVSPVLNVAETLKMEITAMPDRVETATVTRDSAGNITKTVKTEKDA